MAQERWPKHSASHKSKYHLFQLQHSNSATSPKHLLLFGNKKTPTNKLGQVKPLETVLLGEGFQSFYLYIHLYKMKTIQ